MTESRLAPALPKRIQYQRGVPLPPGACYVGRPSPWGNPFPVRVRRGPEYTRAVAIVVVRFALYLEAIPRLVELARKELAGRDLACWCRVDDPFCHADVWRHEVNPVTGSLELHRRAEYWMGVADWLQHGSADPQMLAGARHMAARWERATFEVIPQDRPRTRGRVAISVGSLLVKAHEMDAARLWVKERLDDDSVPVWADQELRELLIDG